MDATVIVRSGADASCLVARYTIAVSCVAGAVSLWACRDTIRVALRPSNATPDSSAERYFDFVICYSLRLRGSRKSIIPTTNVMAAITIGYHSPAYGLPVRATSAVAISGKKPPNHPVPV